MDLQNIACFHSCGLWCCLYSCQFLEKLLAWPFVYAWICLYFIEKVTVSCVSMNFLLCIKYWNEKQRTTNGNWIFGIHNIECSRTCFFVRFEGNKDYFCRLSQVGVMQKTEKLENRKTKPNQIIPNRSNGLVWFFSIKLDLLVCIWRKLKKILIRIGFLLEKSKKTKPNQMVYICS